MSMLTLNMMVNATVMGADVGVAVGVDEGVEVVGVGGAPGDRESGKLSRRWRKLKMVIYYSKPSKICKRN